MICWNITMNSTVPFWSGGWEFPEVSLVGFAWNSPSLWLFLIVSISSCPLVLPFLLGDPLHSAYLQTRGRDIGKTHCLLTPVTRQQTGLALPWQLQSTQRVNLVTSGQLLFSLGSDLLPRCLKVHSLLLFVPTPWSSLLLSYLFFEIWLCW